MMLMCEAFDVEPEKWKWWYLIAYPVLYIVGGIVFVFCYTVLIYWLMSI